MKFLFDFFPVILFFSIFKWGDSHTDAAQSLMSQYMSGFVSGGVVTPDQAPILLATTVMMLASVCQIFYLFVRGKKIDPPLWISLAVLGVFGSASIYFHNDSFIKWKPTVLYWFFGLAIWVSQTFFKKNPIRSMMQDGISLPDEVWQRLALAWVAFFATMGCINLYVAFTFSRSAWVTFKLFGGMGLMIAFIIGQAVFLSKYMKEPE